MSIHKRALDEHLDWLWENQYINVVQHTVAQTKNQDCSIHLRYGQDRAEDDDTPTYGKILRHNVLNRSSSISR